MVLPTFSSLPAAASLSLPLSPCSDLVKDRLGLFAQTIHDLSIIANCFGALASLFWVRHVAQPARPCGSSSHWVVF